MTDNVLMVTIPLDEYRSLIQRDSCINEDNVALTRRNAELTYENDILRDIVFNDHPELNGLISMSHSELLAYIAKQKASDILI